MFKLTTNPFSRKLYEICKQIYSAQIQKVNLLFALKLSLRQLEKCPFRFHCLVVWSHRNWFRSYFLTFAFLSEIQSYELCLFFFFQIITAKRSIVHSCGH